MASTSIPSSAMLQETRLLDEKGAARFKSHPNVPRNGASSLETRNENESVNLVTWDGDNDIANPRNWSTARKAKNLVPICYCSFLSPLGSTMFAPAIEQVMDSFNSTNPMLSSFSVSIWILGYFFGPLVLAPLSEMYGRYPVYVVCNIFFTIFNIATALAPSLPALIAFRFLAGTFGGCPIVIGAGSVGDAVKLENRGKVVAAWSIGVIMGPILGPIAGGYMGETIGWRWICWTLAIAAGLGTIACILLQEETYPTILLERKAARLRKETGNMELSAAEKTDKNATQVFARSIIRPIRLLFLSPIVASLSLYQGMSYGGMYLLFTTFPMVFRTQYGFSTGAIGLVYIGMGVGSVISVPIVGWFSDRTAKRKMESGEQSKPEDRLPPLILLCFGMPIGLFWYGWSAYTKIHWIMPIIGTVFIGIGTNALVMCVSLYFVDAHPLYEASAIAAGASVRSLIGAVLPLAGGAMYKTLDLGWGNSLLGFLALALCPLPWVFYKYGEKVRTNPKYQLKM